MIGDPTGALTRNFDNMREDEGLADRATFVVDPQGIIQRSKLPLKVSAVTRLTCCVKLKQHSTLPLTGRSMPGEMEEGEATLAPSLDTVGKI